MASSIIGSVVCTPSAATVGEDVLVEVRDVNGRPFANRETADIRINGRPGSSQWLRWATAGQKRVSVTAVARPGDGIQRVEQFIEVKSGEDAARLDVAASLEDPTTLLFTIALPESRSPRERARLRPAEPGLRPRLATGTVDAARTLARATPGRTASLLSSQAGAVTYEWDFGDGVKLGTPGPTIGHDFGPSLDPDRDRQVFNVTARVMRPGATPLVVHRTVCIVNAYAIAKRRSVLVPPTRGDNTVHFEDGSFRGRMSVYNPESFDIHLGSSRVEVFFEDPEHGSRMLEPTRASIRLPGEETTEIDVKVASSRVPADAIGFAVHYGGSAGRTRVRVSAYYDIPGRRKRRLLVTDAALAGLLDGMVDARMTASPRSISVAEMRSLERRGLVRVTPEQRQASRLLGPARAATAKPMAGHVEAGPAVVGERCHPENLPDDIPDGLACLATSEEVWEEVPARFMNAKKGDVVLSPGGNGFIGGLLRQVGQHYSHSGIMTRNHDEITHSTASPERLLDHPEGGGDPTDGYEPLVLKYLWPGAITQTVAGAVDGEDFEDPDGVTYTIQGFHPDVAPGGGPKGFTPALVVKPDPFAETPEIRATLKAIADVALGHVGNTHYRFFCYTDPTIGLPDRDIAPSDAGWAAGTFPSVCSSFIWRCVREINPEIEGTPEPGDVGEDDEQAQAGGGDGLYLYSAEERLVAGEWLYDELVTMVETSADEGGAFAELVTWAEDIADDVANQILNTFATDWSDTEAKDSDAWRNTVDAFAVSPSDILFWDAPQGDDVAGLYGHAEPLIYRPARWDKVVVHRWTEVEEKAAVKGVTRREGEPEPGVRVELYDGKFAITGPDGTFALTDVPVGGHVLTATKVDDDGMFLNASVPIDLTNDGIEDLVVDLQLPDPLFREVIIDGWYRLTDYEFAAAAYPWRGKDCFAVLHVGPMNTHEKVSFEQVTDDDVLSALIVEAELVGDSSVDITLTGRIWASEDPSDDIEGEISVNFKVNPGGTGYWEGLKVVNDGGDYMELGWLQVTNELDNS